MEYLKNHINLIHLPKRFECESCDKRFSSNNVLNTHVKTVHEKNITWFKCEKCNTDYKRKEYLDRHLRTVHVNEVTYPCKICDETFYTKHRLRLHEIKVWKLNEF